MPLLLVSNRMIRSRILEILSRLFSWDDDPLKTLALGNKESGGSSYQVVSRIAIDMIKEATVLDELLTGISFLNISLALLEDESYQEAYQVLYGLFCVCLHRDIDTQFRHVPSMVRTSRSKNTALELVIRAINTIVIQRDSIAEVKFTNIKKKKDMQLTHLLFEGRPLS